ncbi:autotransporter domain-containing protein [Bradyrhizobium sp. SYSU BS000235]|uniref:autotransporter domain-containing protein n=1 Tax=Bradyrhizobium sp. SYSU BS000235 TaxID=3411332 RepID=UPI003C70A938
MNSTALLRLCCAGALGFTLSGALLATPAWADCSPQVADGVTATCTGTTSNQGGGAPGTSAGTDGYGTGAETGVTVNVSSGAANTITGANNGINLGDATVINGAGASITGAKGITASSGFANVTNSGTISGTAGDGISAATDATVINTAGGSITSGVFGIHATSGSADVTNSGSIVGTGGSGIAASLNATVTNNAGGSITGNLAIGTSSGFINLTNSGTVTGTLFQAISAATGATVTNNAGASITGGQYGIQVFSGFADITNAGIITGTTDTAISASTNATVINAAGGSITGAASGIVASSGAANVTNSGIITGSSDMGIFGATKATVINNAGGNITGGNYGILSSTGSVSVTNSGSITSTAGSSAAIFAGTVATVINNAGGSITGDTYGIIANAGSANVTNSGSITGTNGFGIRADTSAIVTNNAGGSITGGIAIVGLGDGSSIFNAGTISGDGRGIRFLGGGSSIFNAGTISGGTSFAIQFSGTDNTLTLAQGSVIHGDVQGTGSDTFQLGGTAAATFDVSALGVLGGTAQYQGFSTFNKIDSSVWTLTGTSSFTGDVNVNAGTLVVNGDLSAAGPLLVNPGGTLSGTGTVPFTLLDHDATLAPGPLNDTGTLTIMDSLRFCDCSTYAVKVSGANSDRVNVVAGGFGPGDADLVGLVRVSSPTGNYRFNSAYTILTTQGGLGGTTFDTLATPNGISGVLSYTSNDVLLTLTSQLGQIAGLNGNQQKVATVLDTAFNAPGGSSGRLGAIFGDHVAQNLTQASGELGTASQQTTYQAMNLFMGLMTDPFSAGRGVAQNGPTAFADESESLAYAGRAQSKSQRDAFAAFTKAPPAAAFAQRWNVWAAGYGGSQTTDGNAVTGSNNTTSAVYGAAAGADYWFSPDTVAGFALAGGGSNFSVVNGGSGRSDMFQAGAFVRHNFDATYLTAAVAYGWQDVTTDRYLTVAGVDHLRANFNANAYSGRLELGHRFLTPWFGGLGVSPYAAAQITAFELPSYAERAISGVGTFALNYGGDTTTASRTEVGLRSDKSYALDGAVLTLRGRAAWAHDFNPDRAIGATFQTLPGASFVVNGAALASDSALTTASAEVRWMNGWSVAATFEGEFSDVTRSYAGKGVVRYNW